MPRDRSWERYHEYEGADCHALRERFDWTLSQCVGPRLLDIGCGSGTLLGLARARGDLEWIVGVDKNWEAIGAARQHLAESAGGLTRVCLYYAPAGRTLLADGSFNTVVMGEVLEHVRDADWLLAEGARLLAHGGKLIVTVPNGPNSDPAHVRFYTDTSLRAALRPMYRNPTTGKIAGWLYALATRGVVSADSREDGVRLAQEFRGTHGAGIGSAGE